MSTVARSRSARENDAAVLEAQRMGVLDNAAGADGVTASASADARFLLIAGRPLGEPIVRLWAVRDEHPGADPLQTLADFREGRFNQIAVGNGA
ncbi:pirin-like C-terminal cupin domain-containing protein [Cupriavidus basilensis]